MWKANGRTTDAYPWQKLTWPMARWAKNNQHLSLSFNFAWHWFYCFQSPTWQAISHNVVCLDMNRVRTYNVTGDRHYLQANYRTITATTTPGTLIVLVYSCDIYHYSCTLLFWCDLSQIKKTLGKIYIDNPW